MLQLVHKTPSYSGRILALNPEKAKKFQCYGFVLGSRVPYALVPDDRVSHIDLHAAVLDGRLLDITDQMDEYKTSHRLVIQGSEIGAAADMGETNKKIFFVRQEDGSTSLEIPATAERLDVLNKMEQKTSKLILPPDGWDNPGLYLIKT